MALFIYCSNNYKNTKEINVKSFFPVFQVVDSSQHKKCSSHIYFVTKKLLKEIFKRRTTLWTKKEKKRKTPIVGCLSFFSFLFF